MRGLQTIQDKDLEKVLNHNNHFNLPFVFWNKAEIEELVEHIRQERPTDYLDISQELPANDDLLHEGDDALYQEISSFLDATEEVSISILQRKFRIGYNRSARIIDKLESQGLIEPSTGGKTRKVMR